MRKYGKNFKVFFVNLFLTFYFSFIVLFFSKKRKHKKYRVNNNCLVIGNGPSLNEDLKKLIDLNENLDYICVNFFAETKLYTKFKPCVYVFYDPLFCNYENTESNQRIIKLYNTIISLTTWEIIIFAPYEFKNTFIYKNNINSNITFRFFSNIQIEGFESFIMFCISNYLAMPSAPNVMMPSLIYAINNGYSKIYLAGIEHSLHKNLIVNFDSILYVEQKHFYKEKTKFKPFILTPQQKEPAKIHEVFQLWANVFKGYWLIKKYAKKRNIEILNLTFSSFIDAFKKI